MQLEVHFFFKQLDKESVELEVLTQIAEVTSYHHALTLDMQGPN